MINKNLNIKNAIFLMIDIQEKLLPIMFEPKSLIKNNNILLQGMQSLKIPTLISEQYPKGLGRTVPPLSEFLVNPSEQIKLLDKNSFSVYQDHQELFDNIMKKNNNAQFIISGIEAHICVYQTAKDLLQKGAEVFMVSDAISSRKEEHKTQILNTMLHMGANVLPTESVLFELLGDTNNTNFKTISKLIK